MEDNPSNETVPAGASNPYGATFFRGSTNAFRVFHVPQREHLPSHRENRVSHSEQMYTVFMSVLDNLAQ